jgi:hypothetical protein
VDEVEKREIFPLQRIEAELSAVQPVATLYTNCAIPVPVRKHMYVNLSHFDLKMYLMEVGSRVHICTVKIPKRRIVNS